MLGSRPTGSQTCSRGGESQAFTPDGIGRKLNCLLDVHTIFNSALVGIIKTENPYYRNGPFLYSIPQPKTLSSAHANANTYI